MFIFSKILDFLFPPECLGCSKDNCCICQKCLQKIPLFEKRYFSIRNIKKVYALSKWENRLIKKSIRRIKFRFAKNLVRDLKPFLEKALKNIQFPQKAVFVPVPLHFLRKNKRGFNQSEILANAFSEITHVPVNSKLIYRHKNTYPQTLVSRAERYKNLQNAFSLKNKILDLDTEIFLVDDVCLSGATLNECAKTLQKAGYKNVSALIVAYGKRSQI